MRLKYLRPSRAGHLGIGLAAVVAMALVASAALAGAESASAVPVNHAKTSRAESATVLNPPAHQMSELDFMLGKYTCLTAPFPHLGRLTMYESTRKILDGNYYQMTVKLLIPGEGLFTAYWTLGWDSVDHNYIAQYFDNTGTTGTATSTGWQDGHLKFPGQYVKVVTPGGASGIGKGAQETAQDDFFIVGPGHYIDASSVLQNGQWVSAGANDCQKI
jgi:hypothetical protein